jgi:hypothetical protein
MASADATATRWGDLRQRRETGALIQPRSPIAKTVQFACRPRYNTSDNLSVIYQMLVRNMADDQEQLRQHWQELAVQLGLDTPAPPPPKEAASVSRTDEIERPEVPRGHQDSSVANENTVHPAEEVKTTVAKEEASDQFVAVSEASGDEPPAA